MPAHDWTRVDAGIWHDFHSVWIAALRNALNGGILPKDYYALSEQHGGKLIYDVLTLHNGQSSGESPRHSGGGVAVADAPPKVRRHLSLSSSARSRRKTLTIRHASQDRIVAILEMVSPANKDRRGHVEEFVSKLESALQNGIHVMLIDLFPPGRYDRRGMHGALWERLGDDPGKLPKKEPLTLAAYVAGTPVDAYIENLAVGLVLPDMPLFLNADHYVYAPLETTYQTSWAGTPERWRRVLA